ncbi:serine-rich adhesin for platelets-like [Lytechinus pictus]|uniref:serine-rich adhesin for platelets-like n=1 Tax=Lytechinus pictus TaxID=7653 RepID=UPI0030B9DAB6
MNSAFVTQPNPDDSLLNNGEDQQPGHRGKNQNLEHLNLRSEKGSDEKTFAAAALERDGGVITAGNWPLSASEEMGVVNAEHHIPGDIGEGRVELDNLAVNYEQEVSSNVVSASGGRACDILSKELLSTKRKNGNAINNHIGSGSIMNTDSVVVESSSSMIPSNSDDQNISSSRSRTLQNESIDTRTTCSTTSSSGNQSVASTDPDHGTTISMFNHSRGIETEVIVNQQSNGDRDLKQSCPGGERNQEVTNMQISHVGEMTLTNSNPPQDEECAGNVSESKSDLQVHISRSSSGLHNSNATVEDDKHDSTACVESERSSPKQRFPTMELEESTSPATLDVTSSEEWEDASSELTPRPHFFIENLTDLTPSPSSQQASQSSSSWSSQRTLSVSSTPVEAGSSAISGSREGISETGNVVSVKGPVMASVVPDDKNDTPTRSRTSTATSLSTDFSSNISIATDDLNEAIADGLVLGEEDVGFEEVNLEHGEMGHPTGASVIGSGAKPKKRGLGGFLTRNIFRKSLGKSSHSPGAESSPPGWKLFGRVPAKESMQRDHLQISEDFQKRGQTHPPTSSLTWKKRHTGLKEASSTTALILENRPENLPAKNPEEEEKHKEEYTKMLKEAKKKGKTKRILLISSE